jgi:Cu/Ag efflux protein CusF
MAHVKPGGKEEITWTFTQPGTFMYGCLVPGHWDAGMKGSIVVAASHHGGAATAPSAMTEGEVRKVDREAKKITLKHQKIKNLDMPPMTMVFLVKDPAMLERVKQGDKVRFTAEKAGGAITITSIEAAK